MSFAAAWQPWPFQGRGPHHRQHMLSHESERGRGGRRGRGHKHHFNPQGPWGGFGMPPVPPGPPMPPMPFGPPPRRRSRRGNVRGALLALLSEEPRNGYQLMREIAERSQGAWRPSPGAVYPALQQLTDEELIQPTGEGRRTLYELTESGQTYVADNPDEVDAPWEEMTPQIDDDVRELMELAQQSTTALMQVVQSAGPEGRAKAKRILIDGRRGLYQILAEGEPSESDEEE